MSDSQVKYELAGGVATITLDDGKRNALSPNMFKHLNAALDRAEADKAIVILTGREEVFSAGFDLKVMKGKNPATAIAMLNAGYSLTARVLAFPHPVITACNGHVLAMGVFLMLSTDYVIGTQGDYKVSANEVAIGLPMPRTAAQVLKHRLTPAAFQRATTLAEYFPVDIARESGFFDELVSATDLLSRAQEKAAEFAALDRDAHRITKQRVRSKTIKSIRRSIPLDLKDAAILGVRGALATRRK